MSNDVNIERFLNTHAVHGSETSVNGERRRFFGLSDRITGKHTAAFCTQLSVMLQSGVSLHRSLEVLAQQASNRALKELLQSLSKEVQRGNSFANALRTRPEVFDSLFIVTAEVGQETGRLAHVLSQLASHLEKMNALKRKFKQAMTYPALVLGVATAAVVFLLTFIVPAFAEMFKSAAGGQMELPTTTTIVLALSEFVTGYGLWIVAALGVIALVMRQSLQSHELRERITAGVMKIPMIGGLLLKNLVARFCRTLGTLLQAQVSLVEALNVTQRIFDNKEIRDEVDRIAKHVRQGRAVAEPLVESKLFPPMVAQMIAVGEETSELDSMLLKVAEFYEKELDTAVETLSSVIEPVIIMFLGLFVAGILIAMYLPMFDLVGTVGGGG